MVMEMSEAIREVELSKIRPNRFNPRLDVNGSGLNELAQSIREVGLLEPLIVRPMDNYYEVVVGERRFRASRMAGLRKVPVIIRDYTDDEVMELNLVENVQREDLNAVEKGNSCRQLLEKYPEKYPNEKSLALAIGVSETTLRNWLKLTSAPSELQKMVAPTQKIGVPRQEGKIDWDTALTITRKIKEPERQVEVARSIAEQPIYRRVARKVIQEVAKKPEKLVTEIVKEIVEAPYELPFRLKHMQPILKGIKTQTSRRGIPDPRIKVGAVIHGAVYEPNIAKLRIASIERKKLGDFTSEDAKREGGYTLEQFKEVWKDIHGEWNDKESVYIIHFERINSE